MKLPIHAFRTFWAYHSWAGVACGLVLHLMFVAGAITLFLAPLRVWEEPLQHRPATESTSIPLQTLLDRGRAAIAELPEPPRRLWLGLPQGEAGVARFQYSDAATGKWIIGWLDPRSGALVHEREQMATFAYHLHYLWHPALPELEYLAGILAVVFLLLIVTGVLIHLKDLVRQLWQFRPAAGRRVFWTDLHKVLGVMGLPFQILYCYTGALVVLGPVFMTAIAEPVFGRDRAADSHIAWNEPAHLEPPGAAPAPSKSLDEVLAIARQAVPGFSPISFGMQGYQREKAKVRAYGRIDGKGPLRYAQVLIDQQSGEVLHIDQPSADLASHATRRWLSGLHYTYFGGTAIRVILALLAFAGCATILTGNWIWLARRKARGAGGRPHVLARLTAGAGAGIFVAFAAMFVASRLLPLHWDGRSAIEQQIFFAALLACLAWALAARNPVDVWWQQLSLAGLLLLAVPALAARLSPAGLLGAGPHLSTVVAVEAGIAGCGALLLLAAGLLHKKSKQRSAVVAGADEAGAEGDDDAGVSADADAGAGDGDGGSERGKR